MSFQFESDSTCALRAVLVWPASSANSRPGEACDVASMPQVYHPYRDELALTLLLFPAVRSWKPRVEARFKRLVEERRGRRDDWTRKELRSCADWWKRTFTNGSSRRWFAETMYARSLQAPPVPVLSSPLSLPVAAAGAGASALQGGSREPETSLGDQLAAQFPGSEWAAEWALMASVDSDEFDKQVALETRERCGDLVTPSGRVVVGGRQARRAATLAISQQFSSGLV
jgi:hypothetical protein